MAINVPAIALARGEVAPDNREVLWEDTSNMNLPFYERVKAYDSNSTQWRMVTQFPLELLNELRKVDGDGSGLDANFLQGRTVNDIIQLAKDGSFTLPSGFIFIGDSLGNATARALSGDATLQNTGALILAASGVTAGTYDLATVTVDAKGRVTSASSYTITVDDIPELPQSKITGLVTDLGNRELLANKENSVIDTSTTKYPTVNLLKIGLDTKEPTITAGTTGQYYRGDKTFQTLDKTAVGLGNVDNTSDANKPVSSAQQTALDGKQDTLVSGTNIKTINSESLLGAGNITINSQNLGTNDLTQVDATRTYEMGTGNRILRFLSNAVEKIIFNTASGSPTLQANKSGNGPAIKANKTSGSGSAFEVVGGTSDFGSNKLINVADPTNPQDASTKAYTDTKNINAYDDADISPLTRRTKYRALEYIEFVDDAINEETLVQLRADSIKDAEVTRFGENGSGNVDLKIQENKLPTGDVNGFAIEYTASAECIIGLDADSEIKEFEVVEIYNILKEEDVTADKTLALLDINGNSANVKAKFEISAIAVQNTTANAVTLNIGSTALGTDVVNAFVLPASSPPIKLPLGTTFFSITSGQNLFISSALWNSASINIHVTISKIWQ
jgi:hypothetical protein